MNKKLTIYLLLLTFYNLLFSQIKKPIVAQNPVNGYTINITTKNLAKEKILFYFVYGTTKQNVIVDSLTIKSDSQKVTFKMDKKIIGGIYFLQIASNPKTVELAIDNNTKINLELGNKNIETIKCTLSSENKDFLDYQNQLKMLDIPQKNALRNSLLKKYPNSILNLYFKIENKISETQPQTLDEKIKFRNSFFSFMDKTDKRIYLIPNIYKLLYSYVNILPITNENYIQNIDLLLNGMDCKLTTYPVYTKWFISNLNYFESKNLEKAYTYFFKKYVDDVKCDILTNVEKNAEKNRYITSTKLPNGSVIPDFTMVDSDLKEYKIASICPQNEYTFIAFFSPSCIHCQEIIPKVKILFDQLIAFYPTHKIKVVSILNDKDESLWSKFIADNKLENWLNLKNTNPANKYQETLNAYSNPNFFLVDTTGKIILKSFNPFAIAEIFKQNLKKN